MTGRNGGAGGGPRHAVGIDLAWGERNPTGLAHLVASSKGWGLQDSATRIPLAGIVSWVEGRVPRGAPAWIAVDAPLLATNPEGSQREADAALSRDFRPFRCTALPVDGRHAARGGLLREAFTERACTYGPPGLVRGEPVRGLMETFPTAATIGLFDLRRPLGYKSGDVTRRQEGLRDLQLRLATLDDAALPLAPTRALKQLLGTDPRVLRGAALKDLEDRLDALLAALVAVLAWTAPARLVTYGDPAEGFITVPRAPIAPGETW